MAVQQLQFTLPVLVAHAIETVRDPRGGARVIMGQDLPAPLLWQMLGLVVALSVVLGQGAILLLSDDAATSGLMLLNPVVMAGLQFAVLLVTVHAVHWIGRSVGGVGSFEDSLALMVWLQFIMICLQVVQVVAMLLAQPLADLIGIVGLVLFLWLMTNFVAELHGFQSLGLVFVMILASALGLIFLLSIVLSVLGIVTPGDLNV